MFQILTLHHSFFEIGRHLNLFLLNPKKGEQREEAEEAE